MSDDGLTGDAAGPDDEQTKLLNFAKKCYRRSRDHIAKWREKAKEDYAFVAGDQWSDEDKAALADQLRPVLTFNRVGTIIDSVAGYEVNNRQEVRFIPRRQGQPPVDELYTGAAKWVRDECDAEDEESDAFLDLIVCGIGCTDTRMSYDEDPEGKALIDRIDPLETGWDPAATKRNLDDARYVWHVRKMPRAEVEALADEGVTIEGDAAPWNEIDDTADSPHNATEAKLYKNDQGGGDGGSTKDELTVFRLQWSEKEPVWRVFDPQSQAIVKMPGDRYRALDQAARQQGIKLRAAKTSQLQWKQAFFCGDTVLNTGPSPDPQRATLRFMTGKRDRNHRTWYGLVRAMKDPQRWANKWLSQIIDIINSNAKGGIMAEPGAFEDQRQAEDSWSNQRAITWLKSGAIAGLKIKEKPQTQFPTGLEHLNQFAVTSIRDVTGVNVETLGLADRDQPGILEAHRKQAAMTILAPMFDSLRRYRKEQGRVLLCFIREYLSDGRLIRIEGPELAQYVPLIRQPETVEYDVIVDDAPTSPNQKEQVFAILMQMMPGLMKAGIPIPPDLIDYMPLPSSLTAKWKQTISRHQQQPPPPDPKMIAAQAQAQIAGQKAQADMAMQQQQMQIDTRHQQIQMAADQVDDQRRADLERQRGEQAIIIDRQKAAVAAELQQNKMMADIQEARMRAEADIAIARAKAAADMDIARQRAAAQSQSTD